MNINEKYRELKAAFLKSENLIVPEMYASSFVHWGGGADVQYIYKKFTEELPKTARILVVGVMGGRDYFLFKNQGYDVTALDIGEQPEIGPIEFCNIEEPLPFAPSFFDVVLIGEVLEHLKWDVAALVNIRNVLKPSGKLIVSLPFYNDWEAGHMRIHSPLSGQRLLNMAGFAVKDYLERPGIFWSRWLNLLQHGLSFVSYSLTGKTAYLWTNNLIGRYEWFCGHREIFRPVRRLGRRFGGYYLCAKSDAAFDHVALNKDLYTKSGVSATGPLI